MEMFGIYQIYLGITKGKIRDQLAYVSRLENPIYFTILIIFYLFGAIILPIVTFMVLIEKFGR